MISFPINFPKHAIPSTCTHPFLHALLDPPSLAHALPTYACSHLSLIAEVSGTHTLVLERPLPFNASLMYDPVIQT